MNTQQRLDAFLDALEEARPGSRYLAGTELVQHEGSDAIYFPTRDTQRELSLLIWIDEYDETSITFGDWHTHGSVASALSAETPEEAILSLARGILDSRFVVATDADGEHVGFSTVVWIDDPDAVSGMFAKSWSPSKIHVQSWDGSIDTTITSNSPPIIAT